MIHQAPVARRQGADGRLVVAHAGQAGQVLVEVAVGRADHHGRAVHHVVAGEEERVLLDQPAQVVRGVARGVQRPQRQAPPAAGPGVDRAHPSPTHSSGANPSAGPKPTTRAPVAAASAAAPGAWSTWVCVTRMVRIGAERRGGRHDGGRVGLVGRARVDHDRLRRPDQVGVGARPGHEARIGRGQAEDARRHLVDPARRGGGADPEVRHRRDHGTEGSRARARCRALPRWPASRPRGRPR